MKTQVKVSAILVTQSLGVEHQAMERIGGVRNKRKYSYKLMYTPLVNKKFSLPSLEKLKPCQQAIHDAAWSTCP